MKKLLKWSLIGFGALVVIGIIGSASSSKPTKVGSTNSSGTTTQTISSNAPETKTFKIGDQVNLDGKTITVNKVASYTSKNQFLTPKSGNKFVAVDVTLKNDSKDAYSYNVLEFSLQDNQDYSYKNATTDIEPYITTGAIQSGQTTRGFIPFEIPDGNEPAKLIYTPNFWGTSQVIIDLK